MEYKLYKNDIPATLKLKKIIALDTETMGLNVFRDRLCLIQLSDGDGIVHLIQMSNQDKSNPQNLMKILSNKSITKIFHYARFDLAVLQKNICKINGPIFCTKLASKICRTYGAKHGLKDLCNDLLKIEINKANQTSDWGVNELSSEQLEYAATDVLYLHKLKNILEKLLKREKKYDLALECFKFLKIRCDLDLAGFQDQDIFSH